MAAYRNSRLKTLQNESKSWFYVSAVKKKTSHCREVALAGDVVVMMY